MAVSSQTKKAAAAEIWRLMLDGVRGQFMRASGILQQLGLTPGHMKVLMELEPGAARPMGALAQSFACDASTMTWLVDRLEERGLVERGADPSDRRVKAVALTAEGRRMRARLEAKLYEPPPALLELDRDSLEALRGLFEKLEAS